MKKIVLHGIIEENCYLVDKDNQGFLVDPGSCLDDLKKEIGDCHIQFILLTHGHVDHIDLIGFFDVPIYIHKDEAIMLKRTDLSLYDELEIEPNYDYRKLNIIPVVDGQIIPFMDEEIKVFHTPGHTQGSVCYLYKNKLFSGDTLFKGSVGRSDLPTGNELILRKSVCDLISNLDERIKVYPGHDENTTIKDEKNTNQYYLFYHKQ